MTRKTLSYLFIAALISLISSCSDNSTGTDDTDASLKEGSITVTGDLQAQHEGISQYVGLRSDDGNFINLTLHITEHPLGSEQTSDFSFQIRMAGSQGTFSLETGEYEIGDSGNLNMLVSYTNRTITDNTDTYGSTPNSSGTITILSITPTSIEAVVDVSLHLTEGEGSVNISGALHAECLTAEAGFGC